MRSAWLLIKATFENWVAHNDATQGAALAYYSIFSVGPLLVIAIAIAGLAFGQEAARGEVQGQLSGLLGQSGATAVDAMLAGANQPEQGMLATVIGTAVLLFTALGVVVQLKSAFNSVWEVDERQISGLWQFIRAYLVSLATVIGLGFLLLVSLLFTTALSAAGQYLGGQLPQTTLQIAGSLISFAAITAMFAAMFKWLPDTVVEWRDVWLGAAITAALFELGKLLIGIYIGRLALASTYGAAASLVILLIWVYYTSQIVLLGAEFTHCYASRFRAGSQASNQAASAAPNRAA
jgi:membrane protein